MREHECDGTNVAVAADGSQYCAHCGWSETALCCGGSGFVSRQDVIGPPIGEFCPGCVDCEPPALLSRFAEAVKALATKGYRHLDADEESKAMKVLSALAGVPGCYPEIDALYAEIENKSNDGRK